MKKLFVSILAVAAMVACTPEPEGGENNGNETDNSEFKAAQALAAAVPALETPESYWAPSIPVVLSDDDYVPEWTDPMTDVVYYNVQRVVTEKEVDALVNSDEFVMLDSWDQVAWPGCLVRGDVKSGFKPTSVPLFSQRLPFRLNINVVTGDEDITNYSDVIDFASIPYASSGLAITAINKMMSQFREQTLPAKVSFDISQIQSYEEMALKLGLDAKAGSIANLKTSFGELNTIEKKYLAVNLTQTFFTVYHDGFAFGNLFNEDITPTDLSPYVFDGSPLAYVSAVNYGRRYILLIETTENAAESQVAFHAALALGMVGASTELSTEHKNTLSNMSAKVMILGGGYAEAGLNAALGDMGQLAEYITKGSEFSADNPPAPIGMVVSDVMRNDVINSVSTSKYKTQDISFIPPVRDNKVRLNFMDWECKWQKYGDDGHAPKPDECWASVNKISVTLFDPKTGVEEDPYNILFPPRYQHDAYGAINQALVFDIGPEGKLPNKGIRITVDYNVRSGSKRNGLPGTYKSEIEGNIIASTDYMYNAGMNKWDVVYGNTTNYNQSFAYLGATRPVPSVGVKWNFNVNFYVYAEGRIHTIHDDVKNQK